ncbi:MAG: hypothetical protein WBG93_15360 [Thermoanaerobaculia bacterium]
MIDPLQSEEMPVARLGDGIAGLALGYDPSDHAIERGADIVRLVRAQASEADTIYLDRSLVRESQERGDELVARLRELGHRVDCRTIDHGKAEAAADLAAAISAGCDQITTNTPLAWASASWYSRPGPPTMMPALR